MTDRMEVSDMGRKKQISDQRRLYTERMRLQKGVFSSLAIVIGMSYDKMNKKKFVALDRKDFYAYRKKTLAVFRAALQACNRYPF